MWSSKETTNNTIMNNVTLKLKDSVRVMARAKAFSNSGVAQYAFDVAADGSVTVFDPIAKHYTSCHSLSKSAIKRLQKLATVA